MANSLQCFGVEIGPRANWSGPDNPNFGEDLDVLALDEHILNIFGRKWDDPEYIDTGTADDPTLDGTPILTPFLRSRLESHPNYGIKEPRMCRLLHMWRRAIAPLQCDVRVIHVVRHPLAVARSLQKRNNIPIDRGLALWLEYTRRAHADVDPLWRAVTVSYDRLLASPEAQLRRIAARLKLPLVEPETQRFITHILDNGLRHEVAEEREPLPSMVASLWAEMYKKAEI